MRVDKDDDLGRQQAYRELCSIFDNIFVEFDNLFIGHPHGDDALFSLDANEYTKQTDVLIEG